MSLAISAFRKQVNTGHTKERCYRVKTILAESGMWFRLCSNVGEKCEFAGSGVLKCVFSVFFLGWSTRYKPKDMHMVLVHITIHKMNINESVFASFPRSLVVSVS